MLGDFDLRGALRRIRRIADLSQRELAEASSLSVSAVAHAEAGSRDLPVAALARAAERAGLRLALVDAAGVEVRGMHPDGVRDRGGRRFPAHLDTMLSEQRASRWEHRPHLRQPSYTFDRRDPEQDADSRARNRPDDHLLPQPGDSPEERAATRRREALRHSREERQRRFLAGDLRSDHVGFECTCLPGCDELDDWSGRPVHAEHCPCSCDVG